MELPDADEVDPCMCVFQRRSAQRKHRTLGWFKFLWMRFSSLVNWTRHWVPASRASA